MCSKKMFSMMMAAVMTVGVSAGTVSAETDYEPVTITLNLQRSGLGENVEYTFTEKPSAVVASGEQMADLFLIWGWRIRWQAIQKETAGAQNQNFRQVRKFLSFWNRDRLFLICQKKNFWKLAVIF